MVVSINIVWRGIKEPRQRSMKHEGESLFIFGGVSLCVRYSSMENLVKTDGKMNAEYQKIMGEKFAFCDA